MKAMELWGLARLLGLGSMLPLCLLLKAGAGGAQEMTYSNPSSEDFADTFAWHMGMYDLEPDGRGGFTRNETPVVDAFRAAIGRVSER
jgi:hypothetical protein